VVDLGIPELTEEQFEDVSQAAEDAARKYVYSKVSPKMAEKLDISVEAEGFKPINFTVEIELKLAVGTTGTDEKTLADQAVQEAFITIEKCLSKYK
jgi:hypothetical protein